MATIDQLIKRKAFWAVSVAALAYRLHDVGQCCEAAREIAFIADT